MVFDGNLGVEDYDNDGEISQDEYDRYQSGLNGGGA